MRAKISGLYNVSTDTKIQEPPILYKIIVKHCGFCFVFIPSFKLVKASVTERRVCSRRAKSNISAFCDTRMKFCSILLLYVYLKIRAGDK